MTGRFRYVALAKIASGGTATVYVGTRRRLVRGELVALKRPHEHVLEDPRQRKEVLREAAVAASLHHPNLVCVRGVEMKGEELQLVMDYVEGASLGTLIANEARAEARIPPRVALSILRDAAEGLAAVHEQRDSDGRFLGLVHRDVSPQNILVGSDGVARLTDFGLARATYTGAPSTTQGTLKGKLGYMAPEYVQTGAIDARVDVFALGVVLWESLAGLRLFRAENEAQTLDRLLRDEAPPLADVDLRLAPIDDVVARATTKDPRVRLASGAAFRDALVGATGDVATHAEVAAYVRRAVADVLAERQARVADAMRRARRPLWVGLSLVALSGVGVGAVAITRAGVPDSAPASPRVEPPSSRGTHASTAMVAMNTTTASSTTASSTTASSTTSTSSLPPSTRAHSRPLPSSGLPPNPYDRRPQR